jgi:hypothetical protein
VKKLSPYRLGLGLLLLAVPLWSQSGGSTPPPSQRASQSAPPVAAYGPGTDNIDSEDRMLTPPPVSGQTYPVILTTEERSNYLRGGLTFLSAYSDNVLGATATTNGSSTKPVSDVSYSVWPTIALDQTTSRLHWTLTYAPGFTFYQRTSGRNEADQNAAIDFQYRLSPHVTVSMRDGFQKSSNVLNQPGLADGSVSGGSQGVDNLLVAPLSDRLSNLGNIGIAYQFGANSMVGGSGTFTNLHYGNPTQVPGLADTSTQSASAFYSYRAARRHYVGATYQYQRLIASPTGGQNETRTHAVMGFYTFYPTTRFSVSMFGGPQHYDVGPQFATGLTTPLPGSSSWSPAAGASVNWQGQFTALAASYSHTIAGGWGLIDAVRMDSATASLRQQLARALTASVSLGYIEDKVVGSLAQTTEASTNGHTVSGTAAIQKTFGEHWNAQLGYTRLHQSYNVAAISTTPDTNREFVSISYQFARPLGK